MRKRLAEDVIDDAHIRLIDLVQETGRPSFEVCGVVDQDLGGRNIDQIKGAGSQLCGSALSGMTMFSSTLSFPISLKK